MYNYFCISVVIKYIEIDSLTVLGIKNVNLIVFGEAVAPLESVASDVFKIYKVVSFYPFAPPFL